MSNRHMRRKERAITKQSASYIPQSLVPIISHGVQLYNNKQFAEADSAFAQVLASQPNQLDSLYFRAVTRRAMGDYDLAYKLLQQNIKLKASVQSLTAIADVLMDIGRHDLSIAYLMELRDMTPNDAGVWLNLGICYYYVTKTTQAIDAYEKSLSLANHDVSKIYNNLAVAYKDLNEVEQAITYYQKALASDPDNAAISSSMLLTSHYDLSLGAEELFNRHLEWRKRFAEPILPYAISHASREGKSKLRIGYVSPDFRSHPVGYLLLPAIMNHNPERVEVYCYSLSRINDDITAKIKSHSQHWRVIAEIDEADVAQLIKRDGIDILVDLAGHTASNRLKIFAYKPAPVQVAWLGYFNTTGLEEIDYFISDPVHVPAGSEHLFVEKVARLADSYTCYFPPEYAPLPVNHPPAEITGYITFGCFNHPAKINRQVIQIWSEILQKTPNSKLFLKAKTLANLDVKQRFIDEFAACSIGAERLILEGHTPHQQMLSSYHSVDIALDPFPFNGGLTSCEALWMGVPVVTVLGNSAVSRQTSSYLTTIGLTELIAGNLGEYVKVVTEIASDPQKLRLMRAGLREKMRVSALCDGPKFAKNLEQLYQQMWNENLPKI